MPLTEKDFGKDYVDSIKGNIALPDWVRLIDTQNLINEAFGDNKRVNKKLKKRFKKQFAKNVDKEFSNGDTDEQG